MSDGMLQEKTRGCVEGVYKNEKVASSGATVVRDAC